MNKEIGGKQAQFCDYWYYEDGVQQVQPMNFQDINGSWTQKKVQQVLEK